VLVTTSRGLLRATRDGLLDPDAPGAPPQPPPHGEMRVTHLARNGDLWMDIDPGRLGRLREGKWHVFTAADGLGAGSPQVITEDAEGRIWVGMEETHLYRFDGSRFTSVPLAAATGVGSVQALHFDASGTGWAGTAGAGLLRVGGSARSLDKRHGLPSNEISQVISDDQGSLWCGSPEGIFRVRRPELEKFFAGEIASVDAVVLSADDGLGETNCASDHQPSAWKSRSGVLWFATRQGVVAIDPRNEQVSGTPVVVQIDTVRAGDQSWPAAAAVRVPGPGRTVEMDYSVLSLSNPDRVRARVRLQGYDDEWTTADARGVARYARLPPGDYEFVVEARIAGAAGTSARVSLPIIVVAAWWQTLWFRAALVILCLLLAAVAARAWSHRRLRAKLADLEQATALERERARIAQNIHDDLGAGLTRISLLTQASEVADGRGQLDKIYRTVSGLTQSMDAIVWAVNPKNDNLESFANYLVEFAQGFLTDAEIRCRVILPEVLPPLTLPAQFRHDLFLSCKEALNNAVKHARATEVTVQLGDEGGKLVVRISDNGRGLTAAEATGGRRGAKNGLRNMQSRLAGLGGVCEITSSDIGTVVTLTAPLSAETNSP
jgi:signal transduction histidine kinase